MKYKWTNVDSSLKIISISIGSILGISTVVLTSVSTLGISLILYAGIISGIGGTISTFLSESFQIGLNSKKKKKYREICECIEHGIDKLYLFQLKALEDNILTDIEIEKSKEIINEVKNEIDKLKSGLVIEKVKNKLEKNIKKEIKLELKSELKDKLNNLNKEKLIN